MSFLVSSHPFNKLREWGVDVLCNLVKAVLTQLPEMTVSTETESEKAESDQKNLEGDHQDLSKDSTSPTSISKSQAYYLAALEALSPIKYVDIRQKQIECCHQLLQSGGEAFTDGWPPMLAIISSATSLHNEALVRCAFQCYQYIVSDLLSQIPPIYLGECIGAAVAFGAQMQELNVSLTAIGLLWNVADYLHSNQVKIVGALDAAEGSDKSLQFTSNNELQDQQMQQLLPFCDRLTPFQSLWISLFRSLRFVFRISNIKI